MPFFLCSGAKRQEVSFWQNNTKNPSVASLSSQFRSSTGLIYRYTWYAQTDIDMAFRYRCNTHVLRNYKRYNIRWSRLLYIYICIYIFGSHSFIFILCSTFFDVHTLRRLSFVRQWHLPCLRCRMEGSILLKLSAGWQFSYKISLLPVYRQDTLDSQALPYYFHTFTHDVISNLYERDTFDRNIVLICARSSERYVCKSIRMKENFEKKLNRLNALQSVQGFSIELLMQEFRVLFRFSSSVERFENDLHRKRVIISDTGWRPLVP